MQGHWEARLGTMSLKARTALAASALFAVVLNLVGAAGLTFFERERKASITAETTTLVSALARNVDAQLVLVHKTLIGVAATVPREALRDAERAQAFLDSQIALHALFDNGLFLIAMDGSLVAESPFKPNRRGRDISSREFFKRTVETRQPYISKPYRSTHNPGQPAVIMTAPVFDASGAMIGLIEGSLDLLGSNIIADLAHMRIGLTGHLFLTDGRQTMIVHPDPTRIMQPVARPGENLLFDSAVEGVEGSGETINSLGRAMLASFKFVPATGWILGGYYPLDEAYAPVSRARNLFLFGLAVATLLVLAGTWLLMRHLTRPLAEMAAQAQSIAEDTAARGRISAPAWGEIGTLAASFNGLLDSLDTHRNRLARSEERFALAVMGTHDGIWDWDIGTGKIYCSPRFKELLGYRDDEVPDEISGLVDRVHPDEIAKVRAALISHLRRRHPFDVECRIRCRSGDYRWFRARGLAVWNPAGRATRMAGSLTNIEKEKAAERRLWEMAHYDPLTGLPNRAFVSEHLQHATAHASRTGTHVAVMLLDLDKFKEVNDTLGHNAGDEMLRKLSVRLRTAVRGDDWVARLGGDEFVVVLENLARPEDATVVAHKVIAALATPLAIDSHTIQSSTSLGISVFPGDSTQVEHLLRNADTAMYHAKARGGNELQFFTSEMNARAVRKFSLQTALRRALDNGEFLLLYQPQVSTASSRVVGLEALIRWNDPQHGMIPPAEFVGIAEETGLIVPIGAWVLQTACRQQQEWRTRGLGIVPVAVNLSARQFQSRDLPRTVADAIAANGLESGMLALELTESTLMDNTEHGVRMLRELAALGLHISLDDFGTGYSSLAYLKRFAIDSLKIDRSFVDGILDDTDDRAIASSIIALAHSLELTVVAEGVETEPQRRLLQQLGCDAIQGYLIARPASAAEIEHFLKGTPRQPSYAAIG